MIIGTAGHIDHGKTLLVKALTGVDCDRLKEEKSRGITIELGFAYVPIPGTQTAERPDGDILGFVDVPGHERFVHTMLAGAAGIDFVVLVVAADDGVMPQTREHVQILDLLGIREGVVALNKIDLVDDTRRAEVEAQVRAILAGTALADIDILPVSAATGAGIDDLRERLFLEAGSRPERATRGRFRMSVDRAFTLQGAGTVVTGAVQSGIVRVGDTVRVLPSGGEGRVRSLHVHGRQATVGHAGERCAINLAGIDRNGVARGDWIAEPAGAATTTRFDVTLRHLATETKPLRSWAPVHLHVGTSAVTARVLLIEGERLLPGAEALAQIVTDTPLPVRFGDCFVLRDAGAERTIGGGSVIDPSGPARRRRTPERLAALAAMRAEQTRDALAALLDLPPGLVDLDAFLAGRGASDSEAQAVLAALDPKIAETGEARIIASAATLLDLASRVTGVLGAFHARQPELPGMSSDALRVALTPRLTRPQMAAVRALLVADGVIAQQATSLRLPTHSSSLNATDQKLWERIERMLVDSKLRPPQVREMAEHLGQPIAVVRKLCKTMARMGTLIEVAPDRFFQRTALIEMGNIAVDLANASPAKSFTAAEFKDRAGCGRNIGIQVLEHFDRRGITLRRGDARIVVKKPDAVLAPQA
ncbi:MAG: selenocysteine-specific translation elongation factor [Hyphomicrobiaceae bacterium]